MGIGGGMAALGAIGLIVMGYNHSYLTEYSRMLDKDLGERFNPIPSSPRALRTSQPTENIVPADKTPVSQDL